MHNQHHFYIHCHNCYRFWEYMGIRLFCYLQKTALLHSFFFGICLLTFSANSNKISIFNGSLVSIQVNSTLCSFRTVDIFAWISASTSIAFAFIYECFDTIWTPQRGAFVKLSLAFMWPNTWLIYSCNFRRLLIKS